MAAAFTIFEKFGDVCAALNEADRKELCYAICMYGMFGQEVELPYLLKAIFISLKEDIDNSKESRMRGSKGGRPRKNQTDSVVSEPDSELSEMVSDARKPEVSENEKPGVSDVAKPPVSGNAAKTESQTKPDQAKPNQTKGVRRFAPPALADVRGYADSYAKQKGLDPGGFDAERFIDYYTANGWKVGRNAMRDWKAAVRDWVRRDCRETKEGGCDEYSAL